MPAHGCQADNFKRERAELEAVLNSGVFDRAPLLSQFLCYICDKYFAGQAEEIKEYNIAVEALGRGAEFDHAQDSIVRVEAFRLRKRLAQYYESDGAGHELQITVPAGGYVPEFRPRAVAETAPAPEPLPAAETPEVPTAKNLAKPALIVAAVVAVALGALITWRSIEQPSGAAGPPEELAPGALPVIRISAGAPAGLNVDDFGNVWSRDVHFSGGVAAQATPPLDLCGFPEWPFRTRREGEFSYDIPLDPGVYQLHLYFADTRPPEDPRPSLTFGVWANGQRLLNSFDLERDAGGRGVVDVRVFTDITPYEDGLLHLRLTGNALLNALEIVPGLPGRLLPIRLLAGRKAGHHDSRGRFWLGDRYVRGGRTVVRSQRVAGTDQPDLFAGERYGNFTYTLPVTPGTYTLTLHFAETWFGAANAGGGGLGSRVFHVNCNGVSLLRDFDIFKEAGGENRAVAKTFRGIQPDAQNKINLSFVSVVNLAAVNAIELKAEQPAR